MRTSTNAHRWGCSWGAWHYGVDLRTSLQISLTRGSRGCASTLEIHTHTCESCVGKYYTSNLPEGPGGIPPNAWSHNMQEVPLVLQSSFNEHNPVSRFHAYMSFSFSFRYISYIFLAGLCIMQFTVFHVIQFIQLHFNTHTTSQNRTRATNRHMHSYHIN